MSTDPYKAPDADLEVVEDLPPRPVRGIFFGLIIDFGGSILLAIIASMIYGAILAARGLTPEEIGALVMDSTPTSMYGLMLTLLGLVMSFVGGFYCARISRASGYLYPAIMAVISAGLGTLMAWSSTDKLLLLILDAASIAAVLSGARIHLRRK